MYLIKAAWKIEFLFFTHPTPSHLSPHTPLLTPSHLSPHTSFSHLSPHTSSSHLILTPLSSHPSPPHMPTAPHQGEWNGGEGLRSHQEKKVPSGHPQQMFAAEGMTTVSTHITRCTDHGLTGNFAPCML